jgi:acyl-CoA reductase-like NAD-dependent aldehyde dehydrogenase
MPFGGVKASGVGREGARESIDFFTGINSLIYAYFELNLF